MAKTATAVYKHEPVRKKSSSSGKMSMVKMSSMPKAKKASFKKYRGQGR